jgi:hypothetical protein
VNIQKIPHSVFDASLAMVTDCQRHLNQQLSLLKKGSPPLENAFQKTQTALEQFKEFVLRRGASPDAEFHRVPLEIHLREHFLSRRGLENIFQIALREWQVNLSRLERYRSVIDKHRTWQEIYHAYLPAQLHVSNVFNHYRNEIKALQAFFAEHGFSKEILNSALQVEKTPEYMISVRSSASFAAAFSRDPREVSYFYLSDRLPPAADPAGQKTLLQRLHREYRFLTAHETIPGHHLLDTFRRQLANPVRRQIESPLFYEGWAYYAESLLQEYGYVEAPIEKLVDCKRQLWRAARCQIDVGLQAGYLKQDEAIRLLITTGFSKAESLRQIERFQLNPGYQLCYSLGRYEIMQLKAKWQGRLGNRQFHRLVLESGELPFHLLDARLEKGEIN